MRENMSELGRISFPASELHPQLSVTGTRPVSPTPQRVFPTQSDRPRATALPTISICIPAYNEERSLPNLLEFLRTNGLADGKLLEVIIDVSGSTDRTAEVAQAWAKRWSAIHVVDTSHRDGLLKALDRMIHLAKGDFVVRIDADIRLYPSTLDELIVALAPGDVGITSPRIEPGTTRSSWVNRVAAAEWDLHHQVSLRDPKTTLVQAFRRLPISLPADSGVEDAGLQEQITALGYRAVYVPRVSASVLPPSSIHGLLRQRMRTVQHLRQHVRRGYQAPSTGSPRVVWQALLRSVRERNTSITNMVGFLFVEGLSRFAAWGASLLSTEGPACFAWEAVEGTKDVDWSAASR
jgi:cellulose synthase/poly-beta-1,6-N-acetylglucosamine synthase-like glycosyltransferase